MEGSNTAATGQEGLVPIAFHNLVWWWFQASQLVPSTIVVICTVYKQFNYDKCAFDDEYHYDDFKLELKKKGLENKVTRLKTSWLDYYWKFYISFSLWYYIADCWYLY